MSRLLSASSIASIRPIGLVSVAVNITCNVVLVSSSWSSHSRSRVHGIVTVLTPGLATLAPASRS